MGDSFPERCSATSYSVWIPLAVIAALAAGSFYTSLAGQPLLRDALLET